MDDVEKCKVRILKVLDTCHRVYNPDFIYLGQLGPRVSGVGSATREQALVELIAEGLVITEGFWPVRLSPCDQEHPIWAH